MRVRYCLKARLEVETDVHKQCGPYSEYWDEWYDQVVELQSAICEDIIAAESFVLELREFMLLLAAEEANNQTANGKRIKKMTKLAKESLFCQLDMLKIADEQISLHRQLTEQLLFVEAVDGKSE
jgi:hypothetical protein